jgi:predicted transcriptional regulator/transcriptional regulator with XRE-family HTH domain
MPVNMKQRSHKAQAEKAPDKLTETLGLRLQNLRHLQGTTQLSLADQLGVGQTALSHMEQRDDILLSTLEAYITALGGRLHVAATFPNVEPVPLIGDADWQPVIDRMVAAPETAVEHQLSLPTILGPEQLPPSRDVIFSIRPPHAEKILNGTKTVELRRRFTGGIGPGTLALIYTTSPTSALTGFAKIQDVQRLTVPDLWEKHRTAACLRKGDFEAYFSGLELGYAIVLASAKSLSRPVGLRELHKRFGFEPPQSYQYASPKMRGLVERDGPQASN